MGTETGIEWTDHTMNPWHGCTRVSAGCQHCYAETLSVRIGLKIWGADADRRRWPHDSKHWQEPLKWERDAAAGKPGPRTGFDRHLVFCASMADVFEDRDDHVPDRERLFDMIVSTPHLTWQLLTKRPENVAGMVPAHWLNPPVMRVDPVSHPADATAGRISDTHPCWPENVWIGTTCEDQARADERLPHLLALPAPVRFVSAEPLLGRVWFGSEFLASIGWVIVGGESGNGHRPMHLDDARLIVDECRDAGVPVFFKQVGGRTPKAGGTQLDGETIQEFPEAARR